MLPQYQAESFIKELTKGGRTRPWLVQVLAEDRAVPYVVKLFSVAETNQQALLVREVMGSVLAREFELQRPEPALVHFGSLFKQTLSEEQRDRLITNDSRPKFGTLYLEGMPVFDTKFHSQTLRKYADIETVFAFDVLIRNADRTLRKPNLLVEDKQFWLIDHEISQDIPTDFRIRFENGLLHFPYENHIFYKYLKRKKPEEKRELFGTFAEYLYRLNPEVLNNYIQQVQDCGYSVEYTALLKAYLYYMKEKNAKFVAFLQNILQ